VCSDVTALVPDAFDGSTPTYDEAMLTLATGISALTGTMMVTDNTDHNAYAEGILNSAYPSFAPGCALASQLDGVIDVDDPEDTGTETLELNSGTLYYHSAGIQGTSAYLLYTFLDSVEGHSGSPMYFIDGSTAELAAVFSGFLNAPGLGGKAAVGPHVIGHRAWIDANL
jgi:hypothetical protein